MGNKAFPIYFKYYISKKKIEIIINFINYKYKDNNIINYYLVTI